MSTSSSSTSSSSATASPPLQHFGCEQLRSYAYSLPCKRAFHPTLTHQFELEWPWPAVPSEPSAVVDRTDAQKSQLLWRERRQYGCPTSILDFSSDPFLGQLETRRTGFLLTPGHRILLPLASIGEPEKLPDGAGTAYWCSPYRAPTETAEAAAAAVGLAPPASLPPPPPPLPCCAELVVGEVRAVEKVMRRRREAARFSPPHLQANMPAKTELPPPPSPPISAEATPAAPAAAAVQSFFFYTVPYRVRWLSQLPGCIAVSLPCEERVVTLHAPHTPAPPNTAGATAEGDEAGVPCPMALTGSFALPRGVVPLDVAEVYDRPFLAIGTHDHGVLVCSLHTATGAVESVVRCISLKGCAGSYFPVTRLLALFPPQPDTAPRRKRRSSARAGTEASASSPAWVSQASALDSLRDGVLLCATPYEPTATLVKLDGSVGGAVEELATLRAVDTILDVGATIQPSLGPVLCTASRKIVWPRFLTSDEEEEKMRAVRARRSDAGIAERTSPPVLCERMARLDYPLLRLMSGPPVLQAAAGSYVSRVDYVKHWRFGVDNRNQIVLLDRKVSQYVVHSTFQLYRRRSEGERQAAPAGSLITADTATAGRDSAACATTKAEVVEVKKEIVSDGDEEVNAQAPPVAPVRGGKRGRAAPPSAPPAAKTTAAKGKPTPARRAAKSTKVEGVSEDGDGGGGDGGGGGLVGVMQAFAVSVPLEEACSGVAVLFAMDQTIQVAAAHDGHYVSVVTWRIGAAQPPPPTSSYFCPVLKLDA